MKGTIVNAAAIAAGSIVGLAVKRGVNKRYEDTIMQGIGLCVGLVGVQMALKTQNVLIVILSIVLGALIGEWININYYLNAFGEWLTAKMGDRYGDVGQGFITATLIFCVGAMSIVGSLQDAMTGDAGTLYAKSILDGISSVIFSSSMGIGVMLSSVSVLIYQGTITLLASYISAVMSESMIQEMTAVGGLLIIGISLMILKIKTINVANLLPAIPMAAIITFLWALV